MFRIKRMAMNNRGGRKNSSITIIKLNENNEEYYIRGCDWKYYKGCLIPVFIKEVKDKFNIDLSDYKFSYNQNYGCPCGCSPAFVIKGFPKKNFEILIEEYDEG